VKILLTITFKSKYDLSKENILEFASTELDAYFAEIGQPGYRTAQLWKGIYSANYSDFSQFTSFPKSLRQTLDTRFTLRSFKQIDSVQSPTDGTTKYLWELADGSKIESVIIYEGKRTTYCISSQVGCALDCKFCATGKMGLLRNLTHAEIIEQVMQMKALGKTPPTNIVFMGMGEPLLNYEAVMRAADILAEPEGMAFSRKKITISTSGIITGIRRMADENRPYSLAISLNAPEQALREAIMPISRKYPLNELLAAARYYTEKTDKRITFEYVLLDGINASLEDAKKLLQITRDLPCKINIIPCNSDDPNYQPPPDEQVIKFDRMVNANHRTITIRKSKGWEIQAACGQLYAENETKPRKTIFKEFTLE
jgi:23S rRNA (adenine2503-C2)-methyltransferase